MVMSKDENENEKEGRTKQNEPDAERPPPPRTWETARAARYLRGYTGQDAQPPRRYERGHVFKYDSKRGRICERLFQVYRRCASRHHFRPCAFGHRTLTQNRKGGRKPAAH